MRTKRRILIVDDDSDTRDVLELAFSLEGLHIEVAADHASAMKLTMQRRPDVILLDYHINGSTPGDFLVELKKRNVNAQVVLVSAAKDCAKRAAELGLEHHLAKPFELDTLFELIRSLNAAEVH